jgi:general secretion pathway protein G
MFGADTNDPVVRSRGFTLIEILIVVAILGILAAIVVPRYADVSDQSEVSVIQKDLQTLRAQIEMYRFDTGGHPAALQDLVDEGYLAAVPPHPGDGDWVYDENTGKVTSDVDADW